MARPLGPSFDEVYETYGDDVYRLCARLSGSITDAEDLAQEVFVEVFRDWEQFEGRSKASTWLYRIAVNRWRRMNNQREPDAIPYHDERVKSIGDYGSIPQHFQRMTLDDALSSLNAPLREAFILVKAQGLRYREAARGWVCRCGRCRTACARRPRSCAGSLRTISADGPPA